MAVSLAPPLFSFPLVPTRPMTGSHVFFPAWCHPYIIDETTAAKKTPVLFVRIYLKPKRKEESFLFIPPTPNCLHGCWTSSSGKDIHLPPYSDAPWASSSFPRRPKVPSACSRGADRRGGDADGGEVCSYRRAWLLGCFSDRFPRVNSRSRRKSRFGILTRDIFIYGPNKKKKHTEILKIQPKFREPRTAVAQAQPSIVHGLVGILSSRLHETNAGAESRFFFVCLSRARRLLGLPTSQSHRRQLQKNDRTSESKPTHHIPQLYPSDLVAAHTCHIASAA